MAKVLTEVFGIWYLIGAAFVFFMQAGFAMVEAGFTRAKNAGNIIMKNLMDFCLGTVAFLIVGYSFLCGSDVANGFIGWVGFGNGPLTNFASTDWSSFVFNLVFCATAATIVSGAMAERTKFLSYCIYSFVISLIVYPIEAHWVWGPDGWLTAMGFHDFAGSAVIHFVGGLTALIGAKLLGPRIGKFNKDGSPNGIPGHSLTISALGVFILWFGWYGFNGAAAKNGTQLATIFATTTVAPALATCTVMIFTWLKYGKPDVAMSLNGSLAGFALETETYTGATAVTVSAPELSVAEAVPTVAVNGEGKISKIVIIAKAEKMDALKVAMNDIGIAGMTVTRVSGCGVQKGQTAYYRGAKVDIQLLPKVKAEIVVSSIPVQTVVDAARSVLYTGHMGDGKIFIYNVENVVRISSGEQGPEALSYED